MVDKAKQILRLDYELQKEKAKCKITFDDLKNEKADLELQIEEFQKAQNEAIFHQDLYEHCQNSLRILKQS